MDKTKQNGKTCLVIPHEGKTFEIKYPLFKGVYDDQSTRTYADVAKQIDKAGLKRPNSTQVASLLYYASQNPNRKYGKEIISALRNYQFCEFTGNLQLLKSNEEISNGIILDSDSQNLKFDENGKLIMDKSSLIKRLQENDENVKFVPYDFIKLDYPNGFKNNRYMKARYGEEGVEKMAELIRKYSDHPDWGFWETAPLYGDVAHISTTLNSGVSLRRSNYSGPCESYSFGIINKK